MLNNGFLIDVGAIEEKRLREEYVEECLTKKPDMPKEQAESFAIRKIRVESKYKINDDIENMKPKSLAQLIQQYRGQTTL